MEQFVVTEPYYQVNKGQQIGLSDQAAAQRKYLVKKISRGLYEAIIPFHLKRGEEVGLNPKLINKKHLRAVTGKAEFEKQEADKTVAEKIKRFTTAQLQEFAAAECPGLVFPEERDGFDLTNAGRRQGIELWLELADVDPDEFALMNCGEMEFPADLSAEQKKNAIIDWTLKQ